MTKENKLMTDDSRLRSSQNILDALSGPGNFGALANKTLSFISDPPQAGSWNNSLYRAAKDLQTNGYPIEIAIKFLSLVAGGLDVQSLRAIRSAYSKPPRYSKRRPPASKSV